MQKSQTAFVVDARLGSKYLSGKGFTVQKSLFIWYSQRQLQKFVIDSKVCQGVIGEEGVIAADKLNTFRLY